MSILMKLKGKQSRSIRSCKKEKAPIKVVYISNPIKVTTSASKFRALVQQLTGQDAADDLIPDLHPTRFPESTTSTHDDNNNEEFMFNPAGVLYKPNSSTTTTQKNIGVAEIISSREQPETSNSNAQYHDDDDDDDHEQQQLYDVDALFVPEMIDNFGLPLVLNS